MSQPFKFSLLLFLGLYSAFSSASSSNSPRGLKRKFGDFTENLPEVDTDHDPQIISSVTTIDSMESDSERCASHSSSFKSSPTSSPEVYAEISPKYAIISHEVVVNSEDSLQASLESAQVENSNEEIIDLDAQPLDLLDDEEIPFEHAQEIATQTEDNLLFPPTDLSNFDWKMDPEDATVRLIHEGFPAEAEMASFEFNAVNVLYDWPVDSETPMKPRQVSDLTLRLRLMLANLISSIPEGPELSPENLQKLHICLRSGIDLDKPVLYQAGRYLTTFLHLAVNRNPRVPNEVIFEIIKAGAMFNLRDSDGETPLFAAVRRGNLAVVEALLQAGADVNVRARRSQFASILSFAAYHGQHEVFKFLLTVSGVDLNEVDGQGRHVLDVIRYKNEFGLFKLILSQPKLRLTFLAQAQLFSLLEEPGKEEWLDLFTRLFLRIHHKQPRLLGIMLGKLVFYNCVDAVECFMRLGFDPSNNFFTFNASGLKLTFIHYAAYCNRVDILDLFKSKGYDMAFMFNGISPAMLAVTSTYAQDALRYLLPLDSFENRQMCLKLSIRRSILASIDLIAEFDRSLLTEPINEDGLNALQYACRNSQGTAVVKHLIEKYQFEPTEDCIRLALEADNEAAAFYLMLSLN